VQSWKQNKHAPTEECFKLSPPYQQIQPMADGKYTHKKDVYTKHIKSDVIIP
jgi:hypothetical protein